MQIVIFDLSNQFHYLLNDPQSDILVVIWRNFKLRGFIKRRIISTKAVNRSA